VGARGESIGSAFHLCSRREQIRAVMSDPVLKFGHKRHVLRAFVFQPLKFYFTAQKLIGKAVEPARMPAPYSNLSI
jgi:hypothetical protein